MEHSWEIATVWMGLALLASFLSIRYKLSVALVEILVGIAAGNLALLLDYYQVFGLHWQLRANEWIAFLASFGSTSFYFLNAGMKVYLPAVWAGLVLIVVLLLVKLATKLAGVWPLIWWFRLGPRKSNYTTLLMSTGLIFDTISALFGLNNGYISQQQYSVQVTVVIASAIVPTILAQAFFKPEIEPPIAAMISPPIPISPSEAVGSDGAMPQPLITSPTPKDT